MTLEFCKMWLIFAWTLLFLSANCVQSDSVVFKKCCPKDQNLIKVENTNSTYPSFECKSRENTTIYFNISTSPLIISEDVEVSHGMPEECGEMYNLTLLKIKDLQITSVNNICYDRLVLEMEDGDISDNIPKTVALTCRQNETENTSDTELGINRIRKCCPERQAYDFVDRVCRAVEEDINEEWLVKEMNVPGPYIYEVNTRLHCKMVQYVVDLIDEDYTLIVNGSSLIVSGNKVLNEQRLAQGEWCLDQRLFGGGLVARVCTNNAAVYGAYPIRKCCPIGQHFKVQSCNTMKSLCVPDTSGVFPFNVSLYLDPLKKQYPDFPDLLGIRTSIMCPAGKYVTSRDNEMDKHHLNRDGSLQQKLRSTDNYCVEEFDRRFCEDDYPIEVAAALCFEKAPEINKNFFVSFVLISVSAVCLAFTLLVYCSLPELRNLHGRTLICHVGTMLLAFSCLARVQYGTIEPNYCVLFGYSIYFGFVAAFAWLNVMCLDIWWTFGSVRTVHPLRKAGAEKRRFLWYSLYAWSFAILLTLTMFLFDKYPVSTILDANIGNNICWFGTFQNTNQDWPHYIFFVIPMGLITCTNFVLWVLTARHCARVKSEVHRLQAGSVGDRAKRRFRIDRAKYILTGKLWVVMGAGWMAELLSTLTGEPQWLWQVVDLVNELQGVFIFLILVMKPKLYYLIRKRLGLEKPDAQKNGTSSSARTSSTFLSRTISTDERTNLRISLPNSVKQN
ncbi:probable G-protein coupled receptor Mth-like 3 isoform X2 [Choristoneura fumiferana]|uniref:probable G-protein coupled receptor Mth-like 3 isoform X2 n=1 Tax=Choristoneura fumiferana TaxID=7141 RepID=UPI003D157953